MDASLNKRINFNFSDPLIRRLEKRS